MELNYLKTVKTIVEAGSFQRAADALGYAQSTVTFQVQQLEQALGVKLFERIGRSMRLTQAGRALLPYLDKVLQTVEQMERIGAQTQALTGELIVAMPESLLTYRAQAAIRRFRAEAPEAALCLRTENCYAIREQLLRGSVDFGFHYDVGGYGGSIETERLGEYALALVCSPALRDRDFATPHQRKRVCLLTDDRHSLFFSILTQYLSERDIVLQTRLELGSIEAIKRCAASNVGVAILPRFTVERELEEGLLAQIPLELPVQTLTVICAHHKNKWFSPAMERFRALMRETL